MNLLENLTALVKGEITFSKLSSISVHIFHDIKIDKLFHLERNDNSKHVTININAGQLKEGDEQKLKKIIREAVEKEDKIVLEDNAKQLLDSFESEEKSDEYVKIIEYFRHKIPSTDLEILRASIYIKSEYDKGKPIRELKSDLVFKYGERGRNICNLCSAGYFTSYIKPLYEEMSTQENFTTQEFADVYKTVIKHSAFAIFVNSQMSQKDLDKEIIKAMEFNKRYGIHHLNLHGIGVANIVKIQEASVKIRGKLERPAEIESTSKYITVSLFFK